MPYRNKVADLMIALEDYPHVPYWFTLRQATAIVREAAISWRRHFPSPERFWYSMKNISSWEFCDLAGYHPGAGPRNFPKGLATCSRL